MLSSSSVSIFLECAIFNSVYVIPAGRDFPRDLSAVPTDKVRPMSDILNDKWSVLLCTTVKRIIHLFLYNREGGGYLSVDGQQTVHRCLFSSPSLKKKINIRKEPELMKRGCKHYNRLRGSSASIIVLSSYIWRRVRGIPKSSARPSREDVGQLLANFLLSHVHHGRFRTTSLTKGRSFSMRQGLETRDALGGGRRKKKSRTKGGGREKTSSCYSAREQNMHIILHP
jgi:hypothetical protein